MRRMGGAGSLADYVAGWPGERNPGEDAALRHTARWCGERAEEAGSLAAGG